MKAHQARVKFKLALILGLLAAIFVVSCSPFSFLAEFYFNHGSSRAASGNFEEAISDYNQAIKLNPHYVEAYYNRGLAYSATGNREQAIHDYTQAKKYD